MADLEKMLKAYKECIDPDGNCYHCPYYEYGHIDPERCNRQVLDDVLELLKAQEPVKPKTHNGGGKSLTWWYVCGACCHAIDPKDKYCRMCGKAVNWN